VGERRPWPISPHYSAWVPIGRAGLTSLGVLVIFPRQDASNGFNPMGSADVLPGGMEFILPALELILSAPMKLTPFSHFLPGLRMFFCWRHCRS
jgi:hypothetical protein